MSGTTKLHQPVNSSDINDFAYYRRNNKNGKNILIICYLIFNKE